MSDKALIHLLRGLAAFLIAMPGTVALVPDLTMSPTAHAVLLIAALAGATMMSQLPPAGQPARRDDGTAVDALLPLLEALSEEDRAELTTRLQMRAQQRLRARTGEPHG